MNDTSTPLQNEKAHVNLRPPLLMQLENELRQLSKYTRSKGHSHAANGLLEDSVHASKQPTRWFVRTVGARRGGARWRPHGASAADTAGDQEDTPIRMMYSHGGFPLPSTWRRGPEEPVRPISDWYQGDDKSYDPVRHPLPPPSTDEPKSGPVHHVPPSEGQRMVITAELPHGYPPVLDTPWPNLFDGVLDHGARSLLVRYYHALMGEYRGLGPLPLVLTSGDQPVWLASRSIATGESVPTLTWRAVGDPDMMRVWLSKIDRLPHSGNRSNEGRISNWDVQTVEPDEKSDLEWIAEVGRPLTEEQAKRAGRWGAENSRMVHRAFPPYGNSGVGMHLVARPDWEL